MIRPLDLQTLYMNLDKVGKETAQSRDAVHNQQLAEAQKLTKEDEAMRHTVNRTETGAETSDGNSTKVHGDGGRKGGKKAPGQGTGTEEETEDEKAEGFTDPELGRHIDLKG
ncbi:MAG: hypothetical protein WCG80_07475 [Spirochaetales bacterium]